MNTMYDRPAVLHHNNCSPAYQRDAGFDNDCSTFSRKCYVTSPFVLTCYGCCLAYLKTNRQYLQYTYDKADMVCYNRAAYPDQGHHHTSTTQKGPVVAVPIPVTSDVACRVEASKKRGHIVVRAPVDGNFGPAIYRTTKDGHTYQIYGPSLAPELQRGRPPVGIGSPTFGFDAQVRLENVAIGMATDDDLKPVWLDIASATLVELYRQQRKLPSLRGVCLTKPSSGASAAAPTSDATAA